MILSPLWAVIVFGSMLDSRPVDDKWLHKWEAPIVTRWILVGDVVDDLVRRSQLAFIGPSCDPQHAVMPDDQIYVWLYDSLGVKLFTTCSISDSACGVFEWSWWRSWEFVLLPFSTGQDCEAEEIRTCCQADKIERVANFCRHYKVEVVVGSFLLLYFFVTSCARFLTDSL